MVVDYQLPSRHHYNCVSIRRFRVYKKQQQRPLVMDGERPLASASGGGYQLVQSVYMPQARLHGVHLYRNLTIGVSLINNADLESDIVDYVFVGSQYHHTVPQKHITTHFRK